MIELAPPDAKTDRAIVRGFDFFAPADESRAESRDWLQRPSTPIVRGVNFQFVDDTRRDPARANLVARKDGAVHHDDVEAGLSELPRAGRSCRSAADDQYVASIHTLDRLMGPWSFGLGP